MCRSARPVDAGFSSGAAEPPRWAGAHVRADNLLAELAVLGVRQPGPAKHRATLAPDTALALELIA
ncbi:hypothetical protein [Kitasatospora sp. NPDC056273]|uniref:hypothetical protein n=1 Tax=Kitasatospora sp. NPDC056273 TaxID=3345769 RepID=UPI0035D5B05F